MKRLRSVVLLVVAALATAALIPAIGIASSHSTAPVGYKKHKPKPLPKPKTYKGVGTITDVNGDSQTITVDFTRVNLNLKRLLSGHLTGVDVLADDGSSISLDGDDGVTVDDLCPGDSVTVTLTTRKRIHDLSQVSADDVTVVSGDGDCGDSTDFGSDDGSDFGSGDGSGDGSGADDGSSAS